MSAHHAVDPLTLPFDEFYRLHILDVVERLNNRPEYVRQPTALSRRHASLLAARGSKWTRLDALWRASGRVAMPDAAYSPGCYAIFADGVLVYLGHGEHPNQRVALHLAKQGANLERALGRKVATWTVAYRPERFFAERATLELRLIRRLKPELNRTHGNGWGSADRPPVNQNNYRRVQA